MTPRILQPLPEPPNLQPAQIDHRQWLNHPLTVKHLKKLSADRDDLVNLAYSKSLQPTSQDVVQTYIQRAAIINQILKQLAEQP